MISATVPLLTCDHAGLLCNDTIAFSIVMLWILGFLGIIGGAVVLGVKLIWKVFNKL